MIYQLLSVPLGVGHLLNCQTIKKLFYGNWGFSKSFIYLHKQHSFLIMDMIIIYPESKKQYTAIKNFLKEMNINFKSRKAEYDSLDDWQKERIEMGLKEAEQQYIVSSKEVNDKAEGICMK